MELSRQDVFRIIGGYWKLTKTVKVSLERSWLYLKLRALKSMKSPPELSEQKFSHIYRIIFKTPIFSLAVPSLCGRCADSTDPNGLKCCTSPPDIWDLLCMEELSVYMTGARELDRTE